MIDDSTLGRSILFVSGLFYMYYTFWIYAVPFVDDNNFLLLLFPPVKFALLVPATLGTVFVSTLVSFVVLKFLSSWITNIVLKPVPMSNMEDGWIVIGIEGVTCSGTATIALELHNRLPKSELIQRDNYYDP